MSRRFGPLTAFLAWTSGLLVFFLMLWLVFAGAAFSSPKGYAAPAKLLCRRLVRSFRMRVRVQGLERLDPRRVYIFLANHVNLLDGFLLYGCLPWVFRGLELAAHFSWPIYGLLTRYFGNIPVDPANPFTTARGLRRAGRALRRGISILVLPEGHRTRDGGIGAFGRGAFSLAVQSGAPLVPVVMAGAFRVLRTGSWKVTPGPVRIILGEPLTAEECRRAGVDEIRDLSRRVMRQMLAAAGL